MNDVWPPTRPPELLFFKCININKMRDRYTITIANGEEPVQYKCKTYAEIANTINSHMGTALVSKIIVANWLSRQRKSAKYSFITVE
jgi:hypothetical protein